MAKIVPKPKAAATKLKAAAKPKAAPVKPKVAPAKPKSKAAPKKKVLVDHDDNVDDSGSDFDFKKDSSDDERPIAATSNLQTARKKKTASETYTKVCLCRE